MHCPAFIANNNIWVSLVVGGLANGFLYALIALGYTLVYGVLRLINFAHSEVVMAGGFGGLFAMRAVLGTSTPAGFWAIGFMLVGIVAGALAGSGATQHAEALASNGSRTDPCASATHPDSRTSSVPSARPSSSTTSRARSSGATRRSSRRPL